jgi:hypothetical protein
MLLREPARTQVIGQKTAWSVRITVLSSDPVRFPTKVLVFQAEEPADPNTRGWFTAIASPAQLLEYPEDYPASGSGQVQQPYYRLDTMDLVGRNAAQLAELADQVAEELDLLGRNIMSLESFETSSLVLASYRPFHGYPWPGIPEIGPYADTSVESFIAIRVIMDFRNRRDPNFIAYTLDSEADEIEIVDAESWLIRVPEQYLNLNPGVHDWVIKITDSMDVEHEVQVGTIEILR